MNINDTINNLTLKELTKRVRTNQYGLFLCKCGSIKELRVSAVVSGNTLSCGCHRKQQAIINGKKATTHGLTGEKIYNLWVRIKEECKPDSSKYTGSVIAQEWLEFTNFLSWMKSEGWNEDLTISRKNFDLPFQPDNCILVPAIDAKRSAYQNTCIKKYGKKSTLQVDSIQEKIKTTNISKYGYEKASQSDTIKELTKQSNLDKYGVDHPAKLESNREKARQKTIKNGQAIVVDGLTLAQWADFSDFSPSFFRKLVREHGFDYAKNATKKNTLPEQMVRSILESLNINFEPQFKIENRYADFFLPDYNLVIECDGLYWHSDAVNKNNRYHIEKQQLYYKYGYKSLFFRENELLNKPQIVESIIRNKLNLSERIFARKCRIELVAFKSIKDWFNENHLMGCGQGSAYVLKYNNEIVAAMQIVNFKQGIEIDRFATKLNTSIIGGFSKLLSQLPNRDIFTFIDQRYGSGQYLKDLGFEQVTNYPSFVWIKNMNVVHRSKYPSNTGYNYGYYKLWDCGQAKYIKRVKTL